MRPWTIHLEGEVMLPPSWRRVATVAAAAHLVPWPIGTCTTGHPGMRDRGPPKAPLQAPAHSAPCAATG
eukprot:6442293-Amphidinium_carterae.2